MWHYWSKKYCLDTACSLNIIIALRHVQFISEQYETARPIFSHLLRGIAFEC